MRYLIKFKGVRKQYPRQPEALDSEFPNLDIQLIELNICSGNLVNLLVCRAPVYFSNIK